MIGWLGKKEATDAIKGVGTFIDEQQLTKEEQVKYKLLLLEKMAPFKIVQRIIVSIVFSVWAFIVVMISISIWIETFTGNGVAKEGFLSLIATEYVWGPTIAASALYLGGGLDFFKKKK